MKLSMYIKDIKSIKELKFDFPLEQGLYAITGENASGKSTLVRCASTVFFNTSMKEYFGSPPQGASIRFELNDSSRTWEYNGKVWKKSASESRMKINGFYEGSVIFGNRFKNATINAINKLDSITKNELKMADEFVRTNLGLILHDNTEYYKKLYVLNDNEKNKHNLSMVPYFYQNEDSILISQARMSTGENLLISILHSLNIVRQKRINKSNDGRPCLVFLDEIELALHASALRRLVYFLHSISDECILTIFFSTHSLELIRGIKPQNIFYLTRLIDNRIMVTNPCYPAFATRNLYSDDGYGNDIVILVEDDLAKNIVEKVLYEKDLLKNIRVKVLPTGGWTNTIEMARDIIASHLLSKETKILTILDRDIKNDVPNYIRKHKNCTGVIIDYLPINSLEKYVKDKLVDNIDNNFYQKADTYLFQGRPLTACLNEYKQNLGSDLDKDGKTLYGILINDLRSIRKDREDLVDFVVKYLKENEKERINELADFFEQAITDY